MLLKTEYKNYVQGAIPHTEVGFDMTTWVVWAIFCMIGQAHKSHHASDLNQ